MILRIDGLRLITVNATRFTTRGAAMAHAQKIKAVRKCVYVRMRLLMPFQVGQPYRLPEAIHLTRISPGTMDDDGLVSAFKAVIDGLADALGVNDRSFVIHGDRPGIRLTFGQRKEGKGKYAVELEFLSQAQE